MHSKRDNSKETGERASYQITWCTWRSNDDSGHQSRLIKNAESCRKCQEELQVIFCFVLELLFGLSIEEAKKRVVHTFQ
jgi:hypothetical protein